MVSKHFEHTKISRHIDEAGRAERRIEYVFRDDSEVAVCMTENCPTACRGQHGELRAWWRAQEASIRKNGRIMEQFIVGLHHDMTPEQSSAMVRDYMSRLMQAAHKVRDAKAPPRIPWACAFHLKEGNQHAHILWLDRDLDGKPAQPGRATPVAIGMSKGKSTARVRVLWEQTVNEHRRKLGLSPVQYMRQAGDPEPKKRVHVVEHRKLGRKPKANRVVKNRPYRKGTRGPLPPAVIIDYRDVGAELRGHVAEADAARERAEAERKLAEEARVRVAWERDLAIKSYEVSEQKRKNIFERMRYIVDVLYKTYETAKQLAWLLILLLADRQRMKDEVEVQRQAHQRELAAQCAEHQKALAAERERRRTVEREVALIRAAQARGADIELLNLDVIAAQAKDRSRGRQEQRS